MEESHLISHGAIPQRLGRYISEWEWAVCTFLVLNSLQNRQNRNPNNGIYITAAGSI